MDNGWSHQRRDEWMKVYTDINMLKPYIYLHHSSVSDRLDSKMNENISLIFFFLKDRFQINILFIYLN